MVSNSARRLHAEFPFGRRWIRPIIPRSNRQLFRKERSSLLEITLEIASTAEYPSLVPRHREWYAESRYSSIGRQANPESVANCAKFFQTVQRGCICLN